MKPKNIAIAAVLILVFSVLLSGCKISAVLPEEKPATAETVGTIDTARIEELVKKAEAVKKEVKMVFEADKGDNQLTVKIKLDNPNQKPITSVQAWLSFDPKILQGKKLNTADSAFALVAPYDNAFDNTNGLVMLGRSNQKPITDKTITVADVIFDLAKNETVMLEVYDYRDDLNGHTSVNTIVDGKPYNVLIKPESPALVIEK